MNDRECVNAIKDLLNSELEDPLTQYGEPTRNFVHTDDPLATAKFPRLKIVKRGPTNAEIIEMGYDFTEWRSMVLDIYIWTKIGFKWKDTTGTYLKDAEFVKEYQDMIWKVIKSHGEWLHTTYGITGLKNMGEGDPETTPDEQFYRGILPIRVWYFTK